MERRSCTRLTDSQIVLLSWEEHSATLKQLGNVADVASGGIGVLVDHSIPVGTAVTVSRLSFLDFDLGGIVKHLSRRSDCYIVGIEFAPTNDTAALQFQPELSTLSGSAMDTLTLCPMDVIETGERNRTLSVVPTISPTLDTAA
jgi:hypothetical protein